MKKCPYCAEEIQDEAIVCRYCGKELTERRQKTSAKPLTIIGSVLLILGVMLPWASVTSDFLGITKSVYGYETDGIIIGLIGIVVLIIGLVAKEKPGKLFSVTTIILMSLAVVILLWKFLNVIVSTGVSEGISTDIGAGIFVCGLGSVLAFIGGATRLPDATCKAKLAN